MKKFLFILLFPFLISVSNEKPKLVVVISIDQLRYDYLERFAPYFSKRGFNLFLKDGANFSSANFLHSATETGPGHAVILSGSYGVVNGIIANQWYDNKNNKEVYCVDDENSTILFSTKKIGNSPKNFIGSTVGDQLRESNNYQSKVISISNKDRAAILMGGKTPSEVYFGSSNNSTSFFSTSSYYATELPTWVNDFNKNENIISYKGKIWDRILPISEYKIQSSDDFEAENPTYGMDKSFPHTIDGGENSTLQQFSTAFLYSPFANEHLFKFVKSAIENNKLGKNIYTDLLAVSLSANDYVGHGFGPNSHEVMDITIRTDKMLEEFFIYLDKYIGLKNCLIVLTADHGVSPMPEYILAQNKNADAGRVEFETISNAIENKLNNVFGSAGNKKWIKKITGANIYLNDSLVSEKNLMMNYVESVAAETLLTIRGIAAVQTATDLKNNSGGNFLFEKAKLNFMASRSGNLYLQLKPFYSLSWNKNLTSHGAGYGASHGEPWNCDSHVPLLFYGAGLQKGKFSESVSIADIAPTLSFILKIEPPVGNQGKILKDLFKK